MDDSDDFLSPSLDPPYLTPFDAVLLSKYEDNYKDVIDQQYIRVYEWLYEFDCIIDDSEEKAKFFRIDPASLPGGSPNPIVLSYPRVTGRIEVLLHGYQYSITIPDPKNSPTYNNTYPIDTKRIIVNSKYLSTQHINNTMQDANKTIQELQKEITILKAKLREAQLQGRGRLITEEDNSDFGEDMVDLVMRGAKQSIIDSHILEDIEWIKSEIWLIKKVLNREI